MQNSKQKLNQKVCKLCQKHSELMSSHIIPEFMYSSLYDDKHRFHEISDEIDKKNSFRQKGIRERLLCNQCEQHLSKYESYASRALNSGYDLKVKKEGRLVQISGFDYKKFKLFALSILWRAGISNLDIFDQVRLGRHEEIIRRMIFDNDPGHENIYPFILSPIIYKNILQEALIVKPTPTHIENHYAYRFVFGGLVWVFIVSRHKVPEILVNASIDKDGSLTMIPWQLSDLRFLTHMFEEFAQQGKLKSQ